MLTFRPPADLTPSQLAAWDDLGGEQNVFLTGVAGSGKTYLLQQFLRTQNAKVFPVLASTGAAAILLGGRTFHSFFGLGIMEGGVEATVERALKRRGVASRIKKTEGVLIDEISMLSGAHLRAAERIARLARNPSLAWGGLRVIACGDFSQLPPVTISNFDGGAPVARPWAFLDPVWETSDFKSIVLTDVVRTQDHDFSRVLGKVRAAEIDAEVREFLEARVRDHRASRDPVTSRIFPRRDAAESYNLKKLGELTGELYELATAYSGSAQTQNDIRRLAPIPEVLRLKEGALIMIRQNDPERRWVNGSLGILERVSDDLLRVALLTGKSVEIEKTSFDLLDADGKKIASAANFPVNLAYATTIHKSQGATLDRAIVDIQGLWEPGQAYVALSRVRTVAGLLVTAWNPRSFIADPAVTAFHRKIGLA